MWYYDLSLVKCDTWIEVTGWLGWSNVMTLFLLEWWFFFLLKVWLYWSKWTDNRKTCFQKYFPPPHSLTWYICWSRWWWWCQRSDGAFFRDKVPVRLFRFCLPQKRIAGRGQSEFTFLSFFFCLLSWYMDFWHLSFPVGHWKGSLLFTRAGQNQRKGREEAVEETGTLAWKAQHYKLKRNVGQHVIAKANDVTVLRGHGVSVLMSFLQLQLNSRQCATWSNNYEFCTFFFNLQL